MFHEEFKRYWKKVEQNLTCSRVSRKKFYRQTLEAADRFLAEQPEVNFAQVEEFLSIQGYETDLSDTRLHHEIYLSDARRVPPERWKTVLRHPIRRRKP